MGTGLRVRGRNERTLLSLRPANPNHTRSDSLGLSLLLTWASDLHAVSISVASHTALSGDNVLILLSAVILALFFQFCTDFHAYNSI